MAYKSKYKGAEIDARLEKMTNVTWDALVALRDTGSLIAGQMYRITDYETTTSTEGTQSAGHLFDIVVTALDENTLDEKASAVWSKRDTDGYFADTNLPAWDVRYCLDNDKLRFDWAVAPGKTITVDMSAEGMGNANGTLNGTFVYNEVTYARWDTFIQGMACYFLTPSETVAVGDVPIIYIVDSAAGMEMGAIASFATTTDMGKGVVYRLIDEARNDCPYDFKNIMFTRKLTDGVYDAEAGTDTFVYTFDYYNEDGSHSDYSEDNPSMCNENHMAVALTLLNNVFLNKGVSICYSNTFEYNCYGNTFGDNCYGNTFGNYCYSNTFEYNCYGNTFGNICNSNTFGDDCYGNTFGDNCYSNTFGNNCRSNTFGNNCYSNTFGNNCRSNTFEYNCNRNTFGDNCYGNTFEYNCYGNTFGNICYSNTFGNNCDSNTFGDYCDMNTFGDNCYSNTFGVKDTAFYCQYIKLKDGVQYITLANSATASTAVRVQNYTIGNIAGISSAKKEIAVERSRAYETYITVKTDGTQIEYTIDDIINA